MGLQFEVLGPLTVLSDGTEVVVRSRQQRALLAGLLLRANREVPVHTLIDWVWDGAPPNPAGGRAALHTRVARLRRVLGDPSCLQTTSAGYRIDVGPEELDLLRVRQLADAGRAAADAGDPVAAARDLGAAVALWRDVPLRDVDSEVMHAEEVAPLLVWRADLLHQWVDASLAVGRTDDAISGLRELTRTDPFNEQIWSTLLLTLHRAGRQADAAKAYDQVVELLADQLGVEPGPVLKQAHQEVLNAGRDRPFRVPAQLPPDVTRFQGRVEELAELDRLLAEPPDAVTIVAIDGMAGIGKTALAIHWAHRVREHFPDGQLYLNLRGHSPQGPVEPRSALGTLLLSLGMPPERLPADIDARTALFRTELAGRRILLVLDNAHDAEQVRPLLPGSSAFVLITGRNRLRGLTMDGARSLRLDGLGTAGGLALLEGIAGAGRVAVEPNAAADVIRRCGGLPLTIRISAERIARYPEVPLREFADELAEHSLGGFDLGDDDLRSIFDASYRDLAPDAAELFRLLGVVPGTDIGVAAATALAGRPPRQTRSLLTALVSANLLEERRPGRFELHDLLRDYAIELDDGSARPALRRFVSWCLQSGTNVDNRCDPERKSPIPLVDPEPDVAPLLFADSTEAMRWFEEERPALVGAARLAAAYDWWDLAFGLAWALWRPLESLGAKDDAVVLAEVGVTASEHLDEPAARSAALNLLATAYRVARRPDEALACFRRSIEISAANGAHRVRVATLNNMGNLLKEEERFDEAIAALTEALTTSRELTGSYGEATILGNITDALREDGRLDEALGTAYEALACNRGDERVVLGQIGDVHLDRQEYDEAIEFFTKALAGEPLSRGRRQESAMHAGLGHARRGKGDIAGARASWAEALDILTRMGEADTPKAKALQVALAETAAAQTNGRAVS
ncbi:BTAD domain-containing putative transcriptional regulator [Actinophytocola sp.]|uniref:AfsR/SARP family transcriptional regulator n=1 Tax=Actinophytocola sp. TaxID=1872138 RepID=UPI0038999BDA